MLFSPLPPLLSARVGVYVCRPKQQLKLQYPFHWVTANVKERGESHPPRIPARLFQSPVEMTQLENHPSDQNKTVHKKNYNFFLRHKKSNHTQRGAETNLNQRCVIADLQIKSSTLIKEKSLYLHSSYFCFWFLFMRIITGVNTIFYRQ